MFSDLANRIAIEVGGMSYAGWLTASTSRGLNQASASFSLTCSIDRATGSFPVYPALVPGVSCTIRVGGQLVLTGKVDSRTGSATPDSYTLSIGGRSDTRNVVDCSAVHPTGQFNELQPGQIVQDIAQRLGVQCQVEGEPGKKLVRHIIRDGEPAFAAIANLANEHGYTYTDTPEGALKLFQPDPGKIVGRLSLGVDFLTYSATHSQQDQYSEITVKGSSVPTDRNYGKTASAVSAVVKDAGIQEFRPLIVPAWSDMDIKAAQDRAMVEANRRMGKSQTVSVKVPLWTGAGGTLWQPGDVYHVTIPPEGIDMPLMIETATYTVDESQGPVTNLSLVLPVAYTTKKGSSKGKGKPAPASPAAASQTPSSRVGGGFSLFRPSAAEPVQ